MLNAHSSGGEGKVVVISSVSGGGKTVIIDRILHSYPALQRAVTATTRAPRTGEKDGVDYFFYSRDQFESMIQKNEFIEYAHVHGNIYGVPAGPLKKSLARGVSVILNIDVQGMESVRKIFGESAITIFLMPPDIETWMLRLRHRGSESEEQLQQRIHNGMEEMKKSHEFQYTVVNDDLEEAVERVVDILVERGVIHSHPDG